MMQDREAQLTALVADHAPRLRTLARELRKPTASGVWCAPAAADMLEQFADELARLVGAGEKGGDVSNDERLRSEYASDSTVTGASHPVKQHAHAGAVGDGDEVDVERLAERLIALYGAAVSQGGKDVRHGAHPGEALSRQFVEVIISALQPKGAVGAGEKDRWTLDNIYTIARREHRRVEDGKALRPEMWGHVLRLCEQVGCQSRTVGVLRAEDESGAVGAGEKVSYDGEREFATLFHGLLTPDTPAPPKREQAMAFLRVWANSYLRKGNYWDVPETMGAALLHVIAILESGAVGDGEIGWFVECTPSPTVAGHTRVSGPYTKADAERIAADWRIELPAPEFTISVWQDPRKVGAVGDGDARWCSMESAPKDIPIRLFAPALIDPDFNPFGSVEGCWHDDEGWLGAVWCSEHDHWETKVIQPTHWTHLPRPPVPLGHMPRCPMRSSTAEYERTGQMPECTCGIGTVPAADRPAGIP